MGEGLADGISQGQAEGNEFRTAPLGGLGQQILLMLLERPGEVVLREEIRKRLWPNDTFGNLSTVFDLWLT
jgi:DNA-binding winged helix-turn-helix (wHTH) protein